MPARSAPSFLEKEARKFGCPPLISLDGPIGPEQLSYLDVLRARNTAKAKRRVEFMPDAVAEFQGRPLLYMVDGTTATVQGKSVVDLQQLLANRGEHACVAVVKPGQMEVYPVHLDKAHLGKVKSEIILISDSRAPLFFQSLATGTHRVPGMPEEADYVFESIHKLLEGASKELTSPQNRPLKPLEVLSITGRALFFRFLMDRLIVGVEDLTEVCPLVTNADLGDVFSSAGKAAATSAWLDETFNGDLLPLVDGVTTKTPATGRRREYLAFYKAAGEATGGRVFEHLQAILRGWEHVGRSNFLYTINWSDLNFAHIPVGVLSQVYETFSHQWDEPNAVATSVHYTPRKIAQLVVAESLAGTETPSDARVLDAACGAGVFLVLTLRELVRHRWLADGKRPQKDAIHKILYQQLCGFDVSEHALRLAALALYITAIELNSIRRPPRLHRAPEPLQGTVLHNFDDPSAHTNGRRFVVGSLGPKPGPEFDCRFDVVLGNPPWTPLRPSGKDQVEKETDRLRIKALNSQFSTWGRRVLKARGLTELAKTYRNPNNAPDIPFVWRAMEWSKPGGVLGFTLDARLILMQDGTFREAREALMSACQVTGILNGSSLEKTAVWPGMDKPFIALFARNELPTPSYTFHVLTPVRESCLTKHGEFRLDYTSAQTVMASDVKRSPWLLKTLTLGTTLDVEIIEKLLRCFEGKTVGSTWIDPLFTGRGFSLNPRSTQIAPGWLRKLPLFDGPEDTGLFGLNTFKTFEEASGKNAPYQTCPEEVYLAPLLLIPQTPGEDRSTRKSFRYLDQSLCYNQSTYGYSGGKHPDGHFHLALLHVIAHSNLFRYWCLTRSSRIGASWRTFIKEDLDAFPFPDVAKLTAQQRGEVDAFATALDTALPLDWKPMDTFLFRLYGVAADEQEIIEETVTFHSPYRVARLPAEAPPEPSDIEDFRNRLKVLLQPLFTVTQQTVEVAVHPKLSIAAEDWVPPWRFVTISLAGLTTAIAPSLLARLIRAAAETSASRIIMRVPGGGLLLGQLNQRRFWTRSRARLCAVHVAREHSDWFPVPKPVAA